MNYFPVSLKVKDKKCVIIGGGKVAYRKAKELVNCGSKVEVISPYLDDKFKDLYQKNLIVWVKEKYNNSYLQDSFLVIAATNDREVNREIAQYCTDNNILVNVIDSLEESSFIVNSVFRQGDLTISISTNGKSPALSAKIKEDLNEIYGFEYAVLLQLLGEMRNIAKEKIPNDKLRNDFFNRIVRSDIIDMIKEGRIDDARERMEKCLLSY